MTPYLPDSNQQSKTSSIRLRIPFPWRDGMVIWSMLSLWRSVIPFTPDNVSNSSTEPTAMTWKLIRNWMPETNVCDTSSISSLTHKGIGVPQYRFRETFQSRADASQFPNRLSPTLWGTLQRIYLLARKKVKLLTILSQHCFWLAHPQWASLWWTTREMHDTSAVFLTSNDKWVSSSARSASPHTYLQQKGYECLTVDCTIKRPLAFSIFWILLSAACNAHLKRTRISRKFNLPWNFLLQSRKPLWWNPPCRRPGMEAFHLDVVRHLR